MDKSPDAFRTISEVAVHLDTPAHVLRFWESRFPQIRPVKRAGGRRYYRPSDVSLLMGIKRLLHDEGMTIRGVQKILREQGVRHVASLSGDVFTDDVKEDAPFIDHLEEKPSDVVVAIRPEPAPDKPVPGFAAVMAKVVESGQDNIGAHTPSVTLPEPEPAQGALLLTPAPQPAAKPEADIAEVSPADISHPAVEPEAEEPGQDALKATVDASFAETVPGDDDFDVDEDNDAGPVTPLAARIRALPDGASAKLIGAELLSVVTRLQALRDQMADAAHPGRS